MNELQTINDKQGKALFVVLPMEEYERLQHYKTIATLDDESSEEEWEDISYTASDNDSETIPQEVLFLMIEEDISLLSAWRKYRNLSQIDVATQTGLSQSAISQAERKGSKPQKRTIERLAKIYNARPEQLTLE
ncbi:transcriptional regulator [Pasteurellaceae bacterium Macca]|nr:transcriptional regulator [Pasteurellaceae bacterium Macca]